MKMIWCLVLGLVMAVPCSGWALDDVEMLPTRKRLEAPKKESADETLSEEREIVYKVVVRSKSFKELQNVTVKYNIFYEDAELGSTAKPEVKVAKGAQAFASLINNRPEEFMTDAIKLEKASLGAGWYFANGASSRAKDRVVGVWLKAFGADGKMIGEYANPSTVSKKQAWKD
jgi:hypothetical protein